MNVCVRSNPIFKTDVYNKPNINAESNFLEAKHPIASSSSSHQINTRKRKSILNSNYDGEGDDIEKNTTVYNALQFPQEYASILASAIYDLGLKISSPKVLLTLMPQLKELTTEHLKSHLQKYRIHIDRSRAEFLDFYQSVIKEKINQFEQYQGFERGQSQGKMCSKSDGKIILYNKYLIFLFS